MKDKMKHKCEICGAKNPECIFGHWICFKCFSNWLDFINK